MREYQVRFCERLGVKFPGPTRQNENPPFSGACQLPPKIGQVGGAAIGELSISNRGTDGGPGGPGGNGGSGGNGQQGGRAQPNIIFGAIAAGCKVGPGRGGNGGKGGNGGSGGNGGTGGNGGNGGTGGNGGDVVIVVTRQSPNFRVNYSIANGTSGPAGFAGSGAPGGAYGYGGL
jgi:hypothetical protein